MRKNFLKKPTSEFQSRSEQYKEYNVTDIETHMLIPEEDLEEGAIINNIKKNEAKKIIDKLDNFSRNALDKLKSEITEIIIYRYYDGSLAGLESRAHKQGTFEDQKKFVEDLSLDERKKLTYDLSFNHTYKNLKEYRIEKIMKKQYFIAR